MTSRPTHMGEDGILRFEHDYNVTMVATAETTPTTMDWKYESECCYFVLFCFFITF